MKKLIILSATLLAAAFSFQAKAQGPSANDQTTLHVILVDALSITVNHSDVTLTFATAADYQNGRDTTLNGHLTVTSNQPYTINVKAASSNLTSGANTIQTSAVDVVFPASQTNGYTGTFTPVNLTTGDQPLITNATPVANQNIDVEYSVPASVSSVAPFLGSPAGDYTTTLTYTIVQ